MRKFTAIALGALFFMTQGVQASEFTKEQHSEIESIVADYVSNHPEIIISAMQKLEKQEIQRHEDNVRSIGESLRISNDAPSMGDGKRKHYIIDFYDYNCGYCKVMEPMFEKAYKELDAQIVYVDLPVITPQSKQIGVVAQALFNLDKDLFFKFHKIFMDRHDKDVSLDFIKDEVVKIGGDWDKVLKEMNSGRPQSQIANYMKFASQLAVRGTPYLIIDGKEFRGAIQSYEDLKMMLKQLCGLLF